MLRQVVRAGCTPKLKDAAVLVEMLSYKTGPTAVFRADEMIGKPYSPPDPAVTEFQMERFLASKVSSIWSLSLSLSLSFNAAAPPSPPLPSLPSPPRKKGESSHLSLIIYHL